MADCVVKYDQLAKDFAENSYANLNFEMHRRFLIAANWGVPLRPGDSVLELGCGDGYLGQLFVRYGLRYYGVDISPKMVEMAKRRMQKAGLEANFSLMVADVSQLPLSESFDAVVSFMRTFFSYVREPSAFLERLHSHVQKKLIIDLNPRRDIRLNEALARLEAAGFRNVLWRPFFVPKEKKLSLFLLKTLVVCETIPFVRSVPLRWKFHCLLRGEP